MRKQRNRSTRVASAPSIAPSGSSFAVTVVQADAFVDGETDDAKDCLVVKLERELEHGNTHLHIESRRGVITDDTGRGYSITAALHSRHALGALISALLQLMCDPQGAAMLESIGTERS